jgi:ferredoxin
MLQGPIEFCYFSGTGNTALAAARMAAVFQAHGLEVRLHPIEDTDPASLPSSRILGIACPAAAFTTYPLVWRFLRNLRPGGGRGAFLLVTMGGMTMGLVGPVKRLLGRKGYAPLGACRLVMPNNFLLKVCDPVKDRALIEKALGKADRFAQALFDGRGRWTLIPGWPDLIAALIANDRPFASMRKKLVLTVDRQKCTRCGLCISQCPVSNIRMADGPAFADRCELCMRCHAVCPVNAIHVAGRRRVQYRTANLIRAESAQQR